MTKPKHTAGPWKVTKPSCTYIVKNGPYHIAKVEGQTDDEDGANAHLIASAPEMLECLEDILNYAEWHGDFGTDFTDDMTLVEVLKANIANAKGGQE